MKQSGFVGSSVESLSYARAIQENLEHDVEITIWNQGIFKHSKSALESLVISISKLDFGIFVFSPDDVTKIKGKEYLTARDNVIFELGLFMGGLGRERCFIVVPRGYEDLHMPTDLLGITTLTFDPKRSDENIVAALGTASSQIVRSLNDLGMKSSLPQPVEVPIYEVGDYISFLESWMGSRTESENLTVIEYSSVDKELNFPWGTTRAHIETAAQRFHYSTLRKTENTIKFQRQPRRQSGGY